MKENMINIIPQHVIGLGVSLIIIIICTITTDRNLGKISFAQVQPLVTTAETFSSDYYVGTPSFVPGTHLSRYNF